MGRKHFSKLAAPHLLQQLSKLRLKQNHNRQKPHLKHSVQNEIYCIKMEHIIVRGGRIVGAGCMLPMSGNVNLSRELGMRHRAGIGVSEQTDANHNRQKPHLKHSVQNEIYCIKMEHIRKDHGTNTVYVIKFFVDLDF